MVATEMACGREDRALSYTEFIIGKALPFVLVIEFEKNY